MFLKRTRSLGEGQGTRSRRKLLGIFVATQATDGTNHVARADDAKDAINGRRTRGQQQDALAAADGTGDDFGDKVGFAGAGQSLNQANVRRVQRPSQGFALGLVERHLTDGGGRHAQRFEDLGLSGKKSRQQGATGVGRFSAATIVQCRQLMGVKQTLALGQGEQFLLLFPGRIAKQFFPGRDEGNDRPGGRMPFRAVMLLRRRFRNSS